MNSDPRELAAVRRELLFNYGDAPELVNAMPLHVDTDMSLLVKAAGSQIDRLELTADDMPSTAVLVRWSPPEADGSPFTVGDTALFCATPTCLRMALVTHRDIGPQIEEWASAVGHRPDPNLELAGGQYVLPLQLRYEWGHEFSEERNFADQMARYFAATCLLIRQRLAEQGEVEAARPIRRNLAREGHTSPPVRVISLRGSRARQGETEPEREYRHRWIVRGHWRRHWHPKRQEHRPTWIAPYAKGPEGAPLLAGEKVYALRK